QLLPSSWPSTSRVAAGLNLCRTPLRNVCSIAVERRPCVFTGLNHGAWQEAADLDVLEYILAADVDRPDHRAAVLVWLPYDGVVRNLPPLALDEYAIVAVLGVPIDILESHAIGIGAAWAAIAAQTFEPGLQW